jgi:hypothetical protein
MLIESSDGDSSSQFKDPLATLKEAPPFADQQHDMGGISGISSNVGGRERSPKNWRLLHTLKRATLIARQNVALPRPQLAPDLDPHGLTALRQVAERGEAQKQRLGWRGETVETTSRNAPLSYADPLSPLRERDEKALVGLFQEGNMVAIEADISHCLLQLLPEPCWEDNPLEFLREFL